jgi:hypothetical protein
MEKPKRKEKHPTLFVFDGSIRHYEDGSMLELHSKVTSDEWDSIISDTVHYKCFVECLKETACPSLEEPWTDEDDWFRVQLNVAVSRMRNIDALLVAKYNQKKIKEVYSDRMGKSVEEVKVMIEQARKEQKEFIKTRLDDEGTLSVTDL